MAKYETKDFIDKVLADYDLSDDPINRTKIRDNLRKTIEIDGVKLWTLTAKGNNHYFDDEIISKIYNHPKFLKCIVNLIKSEKELQDQTIKEAKNKLLSLNDTQSKLEFKIKDTKRREEKANKLNSYENSLEELQYDAMDNEPYQIDENDYYTLNQFASYTLNDLSSKRFEIMVKALYDKHISQPISEDSINKALSQLATNPNAKQHSYDYRNLEAFELMLEGIFKTKFTPIDEMQLLDDIIEVYDSQGNIACHTTEGLISEERYEAKKYYTQINTK